MASVNKVILVGNMGRDPEMKYLPSGDAVANLALATTDRYKNKSGEMVDATEWHRVAFFGRKAEVCGQYLKKGAHVYIEGSLKTRKYTDKDGVEKFSTEIRGDVMKMLGEKKDMSNQPNRTANPPAQSTGGNAKPSSGFDDMEDDIPF